MKTRRNQRGGGKAKPMNNINSLTKSMGRLRFGAKPKSSRFGAKKTIQSTLPKRSVLKTLKRKTNPKKSTHTLRTFVKSDLVKRNNNTLNMEHFEPAEYIKKVGGVFKGLESVRDRIESRGKVEYLDDFDMIITNIYERLPYLQTALGRSTNNTMNEENIDDMLEEIESVGETLVNIAKDYFKQVRTSRANLSNRQVHLLSVAEAVNTVLVQSVADLPRAAAANTNMNSLIGQLGKMNMKESSVNDLSSLLTGLGL